MPIRDIITVGFLLWTIPYILRKPWIGVLVWSWVSYMNPHRLCWSFAYDFPAAAVAGGTLLLSMVLGKEKLRIPGHPLVWLLIFFLSWFSLSAVFAGNPEDAWYQWKKVFKIHIVTFCILMLINTRERIIANVAVIVASIGYFGVKGGVFSIRTGMQSRVWGPPGGFIEGNNELALALLMILPLARFLQLQVTDKWHKRGIGLCMLLCMLSIIGSYSRGAFLALGAVVFMLILKSRQRLPMLLALALAAPLVVINLPDTWTNRMSTIKNYEQDGSAMGRINAWMFAFNLANDSPLIGGGLGAFNRSLFAAYAPNPKDFHDAHSIYFKILGDMGYVGLLLFLTLFITTYLVAGRTAARARGSPETAWAADLCAMIQVSLVAYAVGGAFLGLSYFDLPYHLSVLVVLTAGVVRRDLEAQTVSDGAAFGLPGMPTPAAAPPATRETSLPGDRPPG